jgi:hypothetical protein
LRATPVTNGTVITRGGLTFTDADPNSGQAVDEACQQTDKVHLSLRIVTDG